MLLGTRSCYAAPLNPLCCVGGLAFLPSFRYTSQTATVPLFVVPLADCSSPPLSQMLSVSFAVRSGAVRRPSSSVDLATWLTVALCFVLCAGRGKRDSISNYTWRSYVDVEIGEEKVGRIWKE